MARTVKEIFDGMITVKDGEARLATLTSNSATAIWRLILYVASFGIQTLERIFDTHRAEVNQIIDNILPHRPKWYRDKSLNFMVDMLLIPDTDRYDTSEMTEEQINELRVVKYATAIEEPSSSVLVIKIATGEPGALHPLGPEQAEQFRAYINEIRDAGVRWNLINLPGDEFRATIDVFFSPLLTEHDVQRNVMTAIQSHITGLPFNGEFSNMALVDAIQQVEGVRIAEIRQAFIDGVLIDMKTIPAAGYFTFLEENITLNLTAHNAIQ